MYVCMYVYMYVCIYVCMYVCVCMYTLLVATSVIFPSCLPTASHIVSGGAAAEALGDRRRAICQFKEAHRLLQEAPKPWSTDAVNVLADLEYSLASIYCSYRQYTKAEEMLMSCIHRLLRLSRVGGDWEQKEVGRRLPYHYSRLATVKVREERVLM